jgi:hypothetical protein
VFTRVALVKVHKRVVGSLGPKVRKGQSTNIDGFGGLVGSGGGFCGFSSWGNRRNS